MASPDPRNTTKMKIAKESLTLDIDVGDVVLTGKFKNKRTIVKEKAAK